MPAEGALAYCRFCKSKKIQFIFKKQNIDIYKCLSCKMTFLGNDIDNTSIKALYKYYAYNKLSNYLSPITKLRYENFLDSFEKYRKNNFIIDIGCGAGYFMVCAVERRWQVEGSEISDEAIKLAEEKGQSVLKGDIISFDLEKDKYDIATLFELIEHAADPEGIIKKLSYAVRPGGAVYITTPNYNSLTRRLLQERWGMFNREHLFYFTPKTLVMLLEKHNFKIKKIRTENLLFAEVLKIFKRTVAVDMCSAYKKQEYIRHLIEQRRPFFILKKLANFLLNACKIGDTIYLFAENRKTYQGISS